MYVKLYVTICSDVYSLCVAYPEPLADRLYNETKRFLINHVEHMLVQVSNEKQDMLQAYYRAWMEYSQGIYYLHSLYLYLNQQHIKKQKLSEAELIYGVNSNNDDECQEQMEIGELGLDIWKKKMIMPLKDKLVSLLLVCIDADRDSKYELAPDDVIDVICGVIDSFVQVEKYKMKGQLNVMYYYVHYIIAITTLLLLYIY